MEENKPTYRELEKKLQEAEKTIAALTGFRRENGGGKENGG
jgi:hypothetical protein